VKNPAFVYDSSHQSGSFSVVYPDTPVTRHVLAAPPGVERDLELVRRWRRNTLIVGTPETADALVTSLLPSLETPITSWPTTVASRPSRDAARTLIIPGLHRLDALEQQQLVEWLDDRWQHVHVISLSDRQIFPLVEQGTFVEALYYRLNLLHLDLTTWLQHPH
jgi:hypothetical protein